MKVEMGESLIRSWLRHVEKCEVAELNWKPSPVWAIKNRLQAEARFNAAREAWPEAISTSSFDQLLKQSEVDTLGISYWDELPVVYFVDVAFHSGGLNYGGPTETSKRIYKKLVRSALLAICYFPKSEKKIYFTSPKSSPGTSQGIETAILRAAEVFDSIPSVSFFSLLNENFSENILDEVLSLDSDIADTSELFLRSWQLIQTKNNQPATVQTPNMFPLPTEIIAVSREKVLIASFYFSKFGHLNLGLGNQSESMKKISERCGTTLNSLKGYRDQFDRHIPESPRVGWDRPLTSELKAILEEFGSTSELELRQLVLN